jgi:hypothetical protein
MLSFAAAALMLEALAVSFTADSCSDITLSCPSSTRL